MPTGSWLAGFHKAWVPFSRSVQSGAYVVVRGEEIECLACRG